MFTDKILNKLQKGKAGSDKVRVFYNTLLVTFATLIDKGNFFIINIIVARYFSVGEFGNYSTALGYATFFSLFTNLGIQQTLIRAVNLDRKDQHKHFTSSLVIKSCLAVIVYLVLVTSLYFSNFNTDTIYLTFILGLVRIGSEFLTAFYALNEAKERFYFSTLFKSSFSFTFLAVTAIVVLLGGNYFELAFSRLALVLAILALMAFFTFKNFKLAFDFNLLKDFIKQGVPFLITSAVANVYQRIAILIIPVLHGEVSTGMFVNGYIFGRTLNFIPNNFNKVLVPYLYNVDFKNNQKTFQFAFDIFSKYLAIISFYVVMIFFIFAKEIIVLILGMKYIDSVIVLQITVFSMPFIFSVSAQILTALDLQRIRNRYQVRALFVVIILNAVFIYYFNIVGAAISIVAARVILYVCYNRYLVKHGYIKFTPTFLILLKLSIIFGALYGVYIYVLKDLHHIISALIISVLYALLAIANFLKKDDIRIFKEIFNKAK